MKKHLLMFLIVLNSFAIFSQTVGTRTVRIQNATTVLGENISVGTIIFNISSEKAYVAKTGIAKTETIASAISNLKLLGEGTHTGDVTGSEILIIDNNAVTTDKINNGAVTTTKLATVVSSAIAANTLKNTNVTTDLSITGTTDARTIVSSDGTDVVIPVATTLVSGLMSKTIFDEHVANNAKTGLTPAQSSAIAANTLKNTNVTTDLSITGTTDARTIVSSDGTDAVIPVATTLVSGLMSKTIFDEHVVNNAKLTNATHTGDVTGSGILTISNKAVTVAKINNGTANQILKTNAAGNAVEWATDDDKQTLSLTGSTLSISNGGTGVDIATISPFKRVGNVLSNTQPTTDKYFLFGDVNTASGDFSMIVGKQNNVSGNYSFISGIENTVLSNISGAFGYRNTSSGLGSYTLGASNLSSGIYSFAFGGTNKSIGDYSVSTGFLNRNNGDYGIAAGNDNLIQGNYGIAMGFKNRSLSPGAVVIGALNDVNGVGGFAFGSYLKVNSFRETAVGTYNTEQAATSNNLFTATEQLFVIGNGIDNANRSDALVVLKNGNTEINGEFTIDAANDGTGYTLPNTRGTANQILTTDGVGGTTWKASADTNTKNATLAKDGSNLKLTDTDGNSVTVPLADITSGGVEEIFLSAEYPNSVLETLSGSGSHIGGWSTGNTGSALGYRNYYEWASGELSTQDYSIAIRQQLPSDFTSWTTASIAVDYIVESGATLDIYIINVTDGTTSASSLGLNSTAWATNTINLSGVATDDANDLIIIELRLKSANNKKVRVGDVKLTFNK